MIARAPCEKAWSETHFPSVSPEIAATKLQMAVLTIEGDKAMGGALEIQAKIVADHVTSIVLADTGHWLMEQRLTETKAALKKFFSD